MNCKINLNHPNQNQAQRAKHWSNLFINGFCQDCGLGEDITIMTTHSNHKIDESVETGEIKCAEHNVKICKACGVEINNDEGFAYCPNHQSLTEEN